MYTEGTVSPPRRDENRAMRGFRDRVGAVSTLVCWSSQRGFEVGVRLKSAVAWVGSPGEAKILG